MRTQTNLVPRGKRYQIRRKLPKDLIGRVGPRSGVIRQSIGEGLTMAQARTEAARLAARHEDQFAKVRQSLARPAVPLTPELVSELVGALQASALTADEEIRAEGLDDDAFAHLEAEIESELVTVRKAYARGDDAPIRHQFTDWLDSLGIAADPQSPLTRTLRREFLKAPTEAPGGEPGAQPRRGRGDT